MSASSYSRIKTWRQCPAKSYYKYELKLPEEASPYAERGNRVDKIVQDILTGENPVQPHEALMQDGVDVTKLLHLLGPYRGKDPMTQLELAVSKEWKPVGWNSLSAYVRGKPDIVCMVAPSTIRLADLKTGKYYDEHYDQLELYAIMLFCHYDEADTVEAEILYTDKVKEKVHSVYTREQLPMLIARWSETIGRVLTDSTHSFRAGFHCRWCSYSKTRGGPCPVRA